MGAAEAVRVYGFVSGNRPRGVIIASVLRVHYAVHHIGIEIESVSWRGRRFDERVQSKRIFGGGW